MTRIENWNLILQLCAEAEDEVVDCLRIELLNDFGKVDEFSRGPNVRHLAACFRSFLPRQKQPIPPPAGRDKPVIFFPAASNSNLQNLLPVAREAKSRGLLGGIVAGEAVRRCKSNVFDEFSPVVHEQTLNGHIGIGFLPGSFRRAMRRLKWMLKWLHERDERCALRVRQNYGSYLRLMVKAERAKIASRNLLSAWRPSCVLSTSDFYPFEFQFIWQARKLGIPTSLLQHGEPNDVVVWPTYADTFLTWGESYCEQLCERGAPKQRLHVTGMPASDALFLNYDKQPIPQKKDKPICLVLSHTQDRIEDSVLFEEFGRCLKDTIHSTPGINWRIKLHPSEDDVFYRDCGISDLARVAILSHEVTLEQAVNAADVVCTIRSTAGLQAMMLQKPVVVLDLAKSNEPTVTWPCKGGGIFAKNAEQFSSHVNQLVSDKEYLQNVLKNQGQFLDFKFAHRGMSAAAVVNYMEAKTPTGKPSTVSKAQD